MKEQGPLTFDKVNVRSACQTQSLQVRELLPVLYLFAPSQLRTKKLVPSPEGGVDRQALQRIGLQPVEEVPG
jgi:hypothetical protein